MTDTERISSSEAKARGYEPVSIKRIQRAEAAQAEALSLIPEIETAFEGIERPRITLSVAKGFDDEWDLSDERIAELGAKDPEQRWQDVPDEAIEARQEYFTFSDPEGWRFYLPAYMVHYLRSFPDCGWDAVLEACTKRTHVQLLSATQLRCLDRFMDLCKRHGQYP